MQDNVEVVEVTGIPKKKTQIGKTVYPILKIFVDDKNKYELVYFTEESCGICLASTMISNVNHIGCYGDDWEEDKFEKFNGQITIRNKGDNNG